MLSTKVAINHIFQFSENLSKEWYIVHMENILFC